MSASVLATVGDQDMAQELADESLRPRLRVMAEGQQASGADAAGLQRTLRADGVPASVTFAGQQNRACKPYNAGGRPAFWPWARGPARSARTRSLTTRRTLSLRLTPWSSTRRRCRPGPDCRSGPQERLGRQTISSWN